MPWPPEGPLPTVDVLVPAPTPDGPGLVLIRRAHPPAGWALPGGFVDRGEKVEDAALRELLEETGLRGALVELLGVYSDPARDPRRHTLSVVYVARAEGEPTGGDDASEARVFGGAALRALARGEAGADGLRLAFDHARIVSDYLCWLETGRRPAPAPAQGDGRQ
ncbi:NUDIX hydrolase [Myxococcota bacterium]|nr:NUDIX hydrolase [Myxococcota bacterium]